jgi:hypothetical protein
MLAIINFSAMFVELMSEKEQNIVVHAIAVLKFSIITAIG